MDYAVISDIHLGHDVYALPRPETAANVERINKNLSMFFDRLTTRAASLGKPVTLVILGDLFDFCKASFQYTETDRAELDWCEGAERNGLPVTEKNTAWKLRRIAVPHRPVFASLGRL